MNQQLKQKAFELLIDKIDVDTFEKCLYQFVEDNELDSKSIVYELIDINYKSKGWKKKLENLISDFFLMEELISYQIYSLCLNISESSNSDVVLNYLNNLSVMYSDYDFEYNILYNFYIYNERGSLLEVGYHFREEENIIKNTKKDSFKVLNLFKAYENKGDWIGFLNEELSEEPISVFYLENSENLRENSEKLNISFKPRKNLLERFFNVFKGILRPK